MRESLPYWTVLLLGIIALMQSTVPSGVALVWPLVALLLKVFRNRDKGVSKESEAAHV